MYNFLSDFQAEKKCTGFGYIFTFCYLPNNIGFFEFPLFGQSKLSGRPIAAQYRGDGIKPKYDGRTAVGETGKN